MMLTDSLTKYNQPWDRFKYVGNGLNVKLCTQAICRFYWH